MLCQHLENIYDNNIHPSLIEEEFVYSKQMGEQFLDVWNKVDTILTNVVAHRKSIFYLINDKIIFEKFKLLNGNYSFVYDNNYRVIINNDWIDNQVIWEVIQIEIKTKLDDIKFTTYVGDFEDVENYIRLYPEEINYIYKK